MTRPTLVLALLGAAALLAYAIGLRPSPGSATAPAPSTVAAMAMEPAAAASGPLLAFLGMATFAGGCFWCVEANFEKVPGVLGVISGYTGGMEPNPTYEQVAFGETHHTEAVQLIYDKRIITYEGLLQVLYRTADPTDAEGQYYDRGPQYRPGIYFHDDEQRQIALASRAALERSGRYRHKVAIEIEPYGKFWRAEDEHQDFYRKHPLHYTFYRFGSGRDRFQKRIWGEDLKVDFAAYRPQTPLAMPAMALTAGTERAGPISMASNAINARNEGAVMTTDAGKTDTTQSETTTDETARYAKPPQDELRKRLTPLQFSVTQEEGTERAFANEYWDNKEEGIYVDIVSGEPLFSSTDKYDSGTGWPSFTRPIDQKFVTTRTDRKLWTTRTEVRSKFGDSHLGHVFDDGPAPTGQRFCMNSASLRFVPKAKLAEEGYGAYLKLFERK